MAVRTINKMDRPQTHPISRPTTLAEETEFITVVLVEQSGEFTGVPLYWEVMTCDDAWERNQDLRVMRWEEIRE